MTQRDYEAAVDVIVRAFREQKGEEGAEIALDAAAQLAKLVLTDIGRIADALEIVANK